MASIKALLQVTLAVGAMAQSASIANLRSSSGLLTQTAKPSAATSSRPSTVLSFPPTTTGTAAQQSSGCAAIALQQEAVLAKNSSSGLLDFPPFPPSVAHACLQSVPLDKTAAIGFVGWLSAYLQFQSTIGWLKNPPPSYQQPAVDLLGGLKDISNKVSGNQYKSEYEFEAAVAGLMQQAHEGHLSVPMPAYQTFGFFAPYEFVSYSSDGIQLPQVYVESDRVKAAAHSNFTISPVKTINGQNSVDFLTAWMKNYSSGAIEPNADYNALFPNAAKSFGSSNNNRGGFTGVFGYPGSDNMTITFGNGTSASKAWLTISTQILAGVRSGQDFYDLVVAPADEDEGADSPSTNTSTSDYPTATRLPQTQYPNPVVVQKFLGSGGFCSGYFLNKSSIAVLSIPTFDMADEFGLTFQEFLTEFLAKSKAAGMKKLVIDLQGNPGGQVFLATELFKQLFPAINPFAGSTLRASTTLNVVGRTLGESDEALIVQNPIYYKQYVDGNNNNFSSWQALYGPQQARGDNFTNVIHYNMTLQADQGSGFLISGWGGNPDAAPTYFAAKDILLLQDGYCASTCAIFSESMKTDVGVKSVVVGGLPSTGPMQGVAGTKGSNILAVGDTIPNDDLLFASIEETIILNYTYLFDNTSFPDALTLLEDPPLKLNTAKVTFNFKNQVRQNDPVTPLQFVYEAADCRIFYTFENLKSYEVLWQNAADSLWGNGSLCVKGSTGQPSSKPNVTTLTGGPNGTANRTGTQPTYVPSSAGATLSWGIGSALLAVGFAFASAVL